jgi:hypothetical protein
MVSPSFIRPLLALPLLAALASATYYPNIVTITEVSKVYDTKTITETLCYTKTVHGKPMTITEYQTKTIVYTSYCTETITTTVEKWKYQTDTEYITAKETVYKPTTKVEYATCTETIVKPTTVYVKKYDITTIYQPVPTTCYKTLTYTTTDYEKVVQTIVTKVPVPTTIYERKYETVTLPAETKTHYITDIRDKTKYIYQTEYVTVSQILQVTVTTAKNAYPTYTAPVAPSVTYTPPPIATGGASRLATASGAIVAVLFSLAALF